MTLRNNNAVVMDKIVEGDGKTIPRKGNVVTVSYTAFYLILDDRNPSGPPAATVKFDSTADRNKHFKFRVGSGEVIKGWDQGIVQMSKNELSRMTIPPVLAYGANGFRYLIPPNSFIMFEVKLLDVS